MKVSPIKNQNPKVQKATGKDNNMNRNFKEVFKDTRKMYGSGKKR